MKLKICFLVIILLFNLQFLFAQLNIGGKPYSFETDGLKAVSELPKIYLPKQDNNLLIEEAVLNDSKDRPWQFGKNIIVNIDVKKFALVEELPKGKLYRLMIISDNALSVNFKFSEFSFPENALLYLYNSAKTDIIGGFTSANMQKNGTFSTGLLKGDKIIIEYYEPDSTAFSGKLKLGRVTHGFRGIGDTGKGFGGSGNCNINVACDDGILWSNEINSVCMLVTGGSGFCSAALINNTKLDGKPYVLTANHCYEDPSDMVFMFNWQSATCENPAISPSHDDLSGAVLRAKNSESDFCLFEMNDIPPYTYNVYYAGWNNEDVPSVSSVCIHHPSADIKKISFDDDASVSDSYLGSSGEDLSHWKVVWDRNTTTEHGSSGSPLFNQNHNIVGQLHGGYASCTYPNEPDWFGKFSYSWNSDSPNTRLRDWLDPLNIGITEFEGYDPNLPLADNDAQILKINSPEDYIFGTNAITPSVKIRNRGNHNLTNLTICYQIDHSVINSKTWSGNLATGEIADINFSEISLSFANHFIKFWTSMPNGTVDEYIYNDTLKEDFYIYETVFFDDFESADVWELGGEFQIASPEGLGGERGFPDPNTGFSGDRILGMDLTGLGQHPGDYENDILYDEDYAVSPVIDCRNYENCILSFERQLGVDKHKYDQVGIEIKNDTSDWETVWENNNSVISDTVWIKQTFDISDLADKQKVLLRFSAGPTDNAEQYCGWNIDDVMISGVEIADPEVFENSISVYPNPTNDFFYIEFFQKNTLTFADVLVSDLSGKIVFQKLYSENEIKFTGTSSFDKKLIKVDMRKNNIGVFIIKVKTNTENFADKIVLMN